MSPVNAPGSSCRPVKILQGAQTVKSQTPQALSPDERPRGRDGYSRHRVLNDINRNVSPHGSDKLPTWYTNWIASLPLILLTVLIHVSGLAVIKIKAIDMVERAAARGGRNLVFALIMGCTVVLVTVLHAIDAAIWGVAYILLGALPDSHSAMLYSLGAMTTFGNTTFNLEAQWQLMGVVESLNGVILFGLTVATLFSINDRIPAPRGS
jgi:hypothetical protein